MGWGNEKKSTEREIESTPGYEFLLSCYFWGFVKNSIGFCTN